MTDDLNALRFSFRSNEKVFENLRPWMVVALIILE